MTGTRCVPAAPKHVLARDSRGPGGTAPHLHGPAQPPCPRDGSGLQRRLRGAESWSGAVFGGTLHLHTPVPLNDSSAQVPGGAALSPCPPVGVGGLAMLTRGPEAGSWLTQVSCEAWWNESMEAAHTGGEGLSRVWGLSCHHWETHPPVPVDSSPCKPGQPETGFTKILCPGPDTEEERLGSRNQARTPSL